MTVKEIILEYLKKHGYDGLYEPGECACRLDDLGPCGDGCILFCRPGYLVPCPGVGGPCEGDCEFHIGPERQPGDQ